MDHLHKVISGLPASRISKKKKNLFCFDFFLKKKNLDTSYKEKNSQI